METGKAQEGNRPERTKKETRKTLGKSILSAYSVEKWGIVNYLKNMSFYLDVSIFFKTIMTVFKREGR